MAECPNLIVTFGPKEEPPELGTPEAALRSCINLISRATGQPEDLLAFWLDLYYQVRRGAEAPPLFLQKAMNIAMDRAAAATREQVAKAFGEPTQEEPPEEPPAPPPPKEKPAKPAKDAGAAAAAKFKRETLQRLQAARKNGLSTPQIVKLAENNVTEDQIREILDAKPVPVAVYRILAAALDRRELNE